MQLRWWIPLGVLLGLSAMTTGQELSTLAPSFAGYLLLPHPNACPDRAPYCPQPGDILLYDDFVKFHHLALHVAKSAPPVHTSMVFARPDGTPALLDLTGPLVVTAKVAILDPYLRMSHYPGIIMVRRLRVPLSPEQSRDLTHFALAQAGKSFAVGRVALQATIFNARSGLRREIFGHTYLNRHRWFCSELVVAAGTAAHIFGPDQLLANATFPRNLAYDETVDLSALYHPAALWRADLKN